MSRGPGRSMRAIAEALERAPEVWLADLAPVNSAEYRSLWRAAYRMSTLGTVTVWRGIYTRMPVLITRPGHEPSVPLDSRQAKRVVGARKEPTTHLPSLPRIIDVTATLIGKRP